MKLKLLSLVVGSLFALPAVGAARYYNSINPLTIYNFTQIINGHSFSGEFYGDAVDSDLVFVGWATGNAYLDGIEYNFGNWSSYPISALSSYFDKTNNSSGFGSAYASFSGTQNNFMLFGVDGASFTSLHSDDTVYAFAGGIGSWYENLNIGGENYYSYYFPENTPPLTGSLSGWKLSKGPLQNVAFAVPEPESLALFLLGLPMVAWVKRRKSA